MQKWSHKPQKRYPKRGVLGNNNSDAGNKWKHGKKNYVDIKGTLKTGKIDYYEIKTYAAKASIREAIGQILEYAHYPADKHADRLIIVGPNEPDKFDRMYLKYLRETYHLPIWFRSYSFEKNQLSDLI